MEVDVKVEPKVEEDTCIKSEIKYETIKAEELCEELLAEECDIKAANSYKSNIQQDIKRSLFNHSEAEEFSSCKKIKLESSVESTITLNEETETLHDKKVLYLESALEAEKKKSLYFQGLSEKYFKDAEKWKSMFAKLEIAEANVPNVSNNSRDKRFIADHNQGSLATEQNNCNFEKIVGMLAVKFNTLFPNRQKTVDIISQIIPLVHIGNIVKRKSSPSQVQVQTPKSKTGLEVTL